VVENAIRHGISLGTSVGSLRIEAAQRGQTLVLSVSDNGPSGPSRQSDVVEDPSESSGIGLANTQARLQKLYGRDAYIRLGRTAGITVATIVLPFQLSAKSGDRDHSEEALNGEDDASTAHARGSHSPRS